MTKLTAVYNLFCQLILVCFLTLKNLILNYQTINCTINCVCGDLRKSDKEVGLWGLFQRIMHSLLSEVMFALCVWESERFTAAVSWSLVLIRAETLLCIITQRR